MEAVDAEPMRDEAVIIVDKKDRLSEIAKHYELSGVDRLYVKDETGRVTGVITVESIIRLLMKQV